MDKVYLGMSGGVDSALSAALLLEQGFDVHAVYMRNWSKDLPGFHCPWADDLADAERVAVSLGIDLAVWDCEKEYKETVVDYLLDSYAYGYTPNPDVMCNQTVKFGTFAKRAFAEGADYIATGHYARLASGEKNVCGGDDANNTTGVAGAMHGSGTSRLMRAADEHKDQTYFLWRVPGEIFDRTIFPIGDIPTKAEVRAMCADRGLGIENKPDSDGICFIGPVGLRTFLLDAFERKTGDIIEWESGKKLGEHDGAFLFTIGQRKGLSVGGGPAHYVVATDTNTNTVYVTSDPMSAALWTKTMDIVDTHWISGCVPTDGTYTVRTRHTGELRPCMLTKVSATTMRITYEAPVRTVAPGQSAVFYDGPVCIGGGIIERDEELLAKFAE